MANNTWNGGSDDFTTAKDWSNGAPPTPTQTADIENGNPQITTNVGTIGSVLLNGAAATLSVQAGTVTIARDVNIVGGRLNVDTKIGSDITPAAGGSVYISGGTVSASAGILYLRVRTPSYNRRPERAVPSRPRWYTGASRGWMTPGSPWGRVRR